MSQPPGQPTHQPSTEPAEGSGVPPAPDTQFSELRSTDAAVMRALAHPLRIDILEAIDKLGEATASELATALEQSVANCSFHLKILASGGFIERAEQRGREKPWRSAHRGRSLSPDPDDPASLAESTALAGLYVQREAARVLKFLAEAPHQVDDPRWIDAITVNTVTFWGTAEEMTQLTKDLRTLTDRFAGRDSDPSLRPAGARLGRLFATVNPELGDGTGTGTDQDTDRTPDSPERDDADRG